MAFMSGEAVMNPKTVKWGIVIRNEGGEIVGDVDYCFDNRSEAEHCITSIFNDLSEIVKQENMKGK